MPSRARRWFLDLADVVLYVLILNLAVTVAPNVISESFWLTVVTAIMLKLVLEAVVIGKDAVKRRVAAATHPIGKAANALLLFVVLAGSKFVVIELTAAVFGDAVSLGGFWAVTALILVLMAARYGMRYFADTFASQT